MNPEEYELSVRHMLLQNINPEGTAVHHRRKYEGKRSGYKHEIDLSFELDLAGTNILVLVECKAYKRPVGVEEILEFASRIEDIAAHKGILISTSGFTAGACKIAKSKGIACVRAFAGEWAVVGRFTEPPSPRHSSRFLDLRTARPLANEGIAFLVFDPIDETDLRNIYQLDAGVLEAFRRVPLSREMHPIVEIIESGTVGAPFGQIPLFWISGSQSS